MTMNKINKLMLGTLIAFLLLGLPTSQTSAQTPVTAANVTMVSIGRTAKAEALLIQVGPKQWAQMSADGKNVVQSHYTEIRRDGASVLLDNGSFKIELNLVNKTATYLGVSWTGKILSSSNAPVGSNIPATNPPPTPNPTPTPNSSGSLEQQCFNAIQGKVAYNQAGGTRWAASTVQKLCKGTTNTAATIACFKAEIQNHNSWSRGVEACKLGATIPRATSKRSTSKRSTAEETADDIAASNTIRSPLSEEDMQKVMMWIAKEVAATRSPYCYKQSKPNPNSSPMICQAGYDEETLGLCSKKCPTGSTGIATFCYQNCPAGFRNDGLYCGKPAQYHNGAGFGWSIGDTPFNYNQAKARCTAGNPQGCEKRGLIWYPKCKPGFKSVGLECSPVCPNGYDDIGVSCKKPSTARQVIPVSECPTGRVRSGALCYPNCSSGYTAIGPACWQNCSKSKGNNMHDCGVGCANNEETCALVTSDMVLAPINFITSVLTLGLENQIQSIILKRAQNISRQSGISIGAAREIAANALKLQQLGPKMFKVAQSLEKFETLVTAGQNISDTAALIAEMNDALDIYANEYESSFASSTSTKINQKINAEFGGYRNSGAIHIKRVWAKQQLLAILETEKWRVTKQILNNVSSSVDFLGVKAVAEAFIHSDCKQASYNPFPTVSRRY